MRHRVAGRRLGRTKEHRLAMRRNMVASLFQYETISTTKEKAKEVKPFAEKMITLAKKGTLSARRQAIAMLGNRDIIDQESGKAVRKGTVVGKLFSELGPRYLDRRGGYTRIIRLSLRRLGDNGELVLLQLLGVDEPAKGQRKKRSRKKTAETVKVEEPVQAQETAEVVEVADAEETPDREETAGTRNSDDEPDKEQ
jgi:large subunit ribosomal protein L17